VSKTTLRALRRGPGPRRGVRGAREVCYAGGASGSQAEGSDLARKVDLVEEAPATTVAHDGGAAGAPRLRPRVA